MDQGVVEGDRVSVTLLDDGFVPWRNRDEALTRGSYFVEADGGYLAASADPVDPAEPRGAEKHPTDLRTSMCSFVDGR